jgi:hypothetical protein
MGDGLPFGLGRFLDLSNVASGKPHGHDLTLCLMACQLGAPYRTGLRQFGHCCTPA